MRVAGVIAVQGGVSAHQRALRTLGMQVVLVRTPRDLATVDLLVLPGGESTAQRRLWDQAQLTPAIVQWVSAERPTLATCAGLVLLSEQGLGLLPVSVARNGWGSQVHSFEARSDDGVRALCFIRAPRITHWCPDGVDSFTHATFQGEPVAIQRGRCVATTCHPELTDLPWYAELCHSSETSSA
jgi:5'-phosphate synthase pdxT subunit